MYSVVIPVYSTSGPVHVSPSTVDLYVVFPRIYMYLLCSIVLLAVGGEGLGRVLFSVGWCLGVQMEGGLVSLFVRI